MSTNAHSPSKILPVDQVRERLGGIGRTKLYEIAKAGDLRIVKIGRRTFFLEADVQAYIDRL